jgi:hypothetical protein
VYMSPCLLRRFCHILTGTLRGLSLNRMDCLKALLLSHNHACSRLRHCASGSGGGAAAACRSLADRSTCLSRCCYHFVWFSFLPSLLALKMVSCFILPAGRLRSACTCSSTPPLLRCSCLMCSEHSRQDAHRTGAPHQLFLLPGEAEPYWLATSASSLHQSARTFCSFLAVLLLRFVWGGRCALHT